MKYPKIQTLWKRHEETGKILENQYSHDEFGLIKQWQVQEKIDGTNIRIHFYKPFAYPGKDGKLKSHVSFYGRGENAQIPNHLMKYLETHFTVERLEQVFNTDEQVFIFGEGYGPKIQGPGGNYRKDAGFIAFDIKIGNWWLKQEDIVGIAKALDIPSAPIIGIMNEEQIIEYVKSKPLSLCSITPHIMEGVICRTDPLLLLRNGDRLMFKLKVKDFKS